MPMRRERNDKTSPVSWADNGLADWRATLITRRAFLAHSAAVSVAALFGPKIALAVESGLDDETRWAILDTVQRHLLPSEPESPGAADIDALAYLRFVVADPKVDEDERRFILAGVTWLEDLSVTRMKSSFLDLDAEAREMLLRQVAETPQGENWISTLLLYLMEALLTDPAYGGNPGGIGWRWLEHIPGYPRPTAETIYPRLPI
jgi:gluconate 2-dehydrogenase gamma chain